MLYYSVSFTTDHLIQMLNLIWFYYRLQTDNPVKVKFNNWKSKRTGEARAGGQK